ncbi:MAG TPA: protoporphyrinogen oxidase, partial [Gemmatimonadales bacterium]|nr:protoporphyrinogen oxidase [Gemmatimonadales bacterium]
MQGKVVVIGGGITGLATATRLADLLDPGSLTLIEAEPRLGGKIRTERTDGFVLEGGPDCFLATKPAGVELCRRLGIADRLEGTNPAMRRSYVKRAGRLHPLPDGITGLVPSRVMPLLTTGILSLRGRIRAGLEPLVPRGHPGAEESVAGFASRRFGREAYDWLIEPLLSGIYAGDGEALSLEATFPQLRETEARSGSLLRPMLTASVRRRGVPSPRAGFVTLPGGLGEMVEGLAARLRGTEILTGTSVAGVREVAATGGYRVELPDGRGIESSAVVLATPEHASAALVEGLDPELAASLRAIPFVSTATVSLAFPRTAFPTAPDGYGYVSPRIEGGPLVACTWTSNKFPRRVPPETVLVRCFVGRAGEEEIVAAEDTVLLDLVREELGRVAGVISPPLLSRVVRWPAGMPQYALGHRDRLGRIATP